ncbi:hypothetical protein [Lyticum sinuosum]|uniref:Uncharacterized protein n=1 Tax=Lyticum sinuosum TaxID=1332059 RepID=A0AAE5AGY4_9RICK|nr:hypothetical protein [Lyticum sinuosum]MDZ5761342.1 hypothetical protein [Lyticum sinuosum]
MSNNNKQVSNVFMNFSYISTINNEVDEEIDLNYQNCLIDQGNKVPQFFYKKHKI